MKDLSAPICGFLFLITGSHSSVSFSREGLFWELTSHCHALWRSILLLTHHPCHSRFLAFQMTPLSHVWSLSTGTWISVRCFVSWLDFQVPSCTDSPASNKSWVHTAVSLWGDCLSPPHSQLLLLDLEDLNISETLTSLSNLYEFAWGIQIFPGEVGQALVHAVLSQPHFFRKSDIKIFF